MTELNTTTYCYAHPTRETNLRCKRCERPMCASCAVRTPTGYLCKDCVRSHQKAFDTAMWYDYLTGMCATIVLSLITSVLVAFIGSFIGFFMFFIAAGIGGGAGTLISNITLRVINKRRSKPLFIACTTGMALGALPVVIGLLLMGNIYGVIGVVIYLVIATPLVYTRISGIQL
ncbi:MAG: hypothetical protein ACYC6R_09535 [Anaerolineales bacterium]